MGDTESSYIEPTYIGTVTTDANGSFTYTFQVQGIAAKNYEIGAEGAIDAGIAGPIIVTS
ncbi:MAG TPA: hypothetical protein VL485_08265 [Ktedonobacteraceae bacterium]|nr:hypothetical protein [Ktedonobacteraceae bacterium]